MTLGRTTARPGGAPGAAPGGGYCSRVPPLPHALAGSRFGQLASILPECGSTQDIVRAAAGQNAPEGFLAVADHQTDGRGRLGRTWSAAPGQSLLFSLLLRPETPLDRLAPLTLVAGVAVAEALPVEARVRWPNDVVIGGAKVAGILTELETTAGSGTAVLLGIGVNVNVPAGDLPEADRLPATSLLVELGQTTDRLSLLGQVVDRLQAAYREFEALGLSALLDRYGALDVLAGRRVTLAVGDETWTGIGHGVDAGGRLVLDVDGSRRSFDAGEVTRVLDAS